VVDAFIYGWQDVFSPFSFANLWMLVLILSYRGTTVWRIFWILFFYLLSVSCTYLIAAFGGYDAYYTDETVVLAIRSVYVLFGGFFAIIGSISIIDWFRLNFTNVTKLIICAPVALISDNKKIETPKTLFFGVCFVPGFIGFFMTSLSMVWQEEFVFNTFSYFLSNKDSIFTLKIYFLYFLGQILPFILVGLVFELFLKIKEFQDVAMSAAKIIMAAVSFGLSVNLILLRFI